jgi:polyisoprenoid-binding protein YceI
MTERTPTTPDLKTLTGSWTLAPSQTSVTFTTKAMWVLPVRARVTALEGSAVVGDDGSVSGTLLLDAASFDTKNKKRDAHLRTADFFEVSKYPTILIKVLGATPTPTGDYELAATMTVHGQERPVTLPTSVAVNDNVATVTMETDIDRSKWGISWAKMGAGMQNHVVVSARFTKD